jgi:hypothetical protein
MAPSSQRSEAARLCPASACTGLEADLVALQVVQSSLTPVGSRASLAAGRHECRPSSLRPDPCKFLTPT